MRILRFFAGMFVIFATPAFAGGASPAWVVSQKSGDVLVFHPGMQPASVQVSASLAPGDVVATGPTGRAMLTRGKDYVVVAPGSRLLLPREQEQSGFTRLVQQVGTMLYKVHHTGLPHFAVQTPMLAAVVKGTSFTIIVDQDRAAVQVTDGIVEVTSAVGQARRLVERGTTVYVGRERPGSILELKPGEVGLSSSTSQSVKVAGSGDAPLSAVADLTGGLVHATAASPVVASGTAVPTSTIVTQAVVTWTAETASPAASPTGSNVATTPASGAVQTAATQPSTSSPPASSGVTQPATNIQTTVATGAQPASVPTATQPAVVVVQTTVPAITQPVVNTVTATAQPVISTVTATTQPVVDTVTAITQPVISTVTATTQPVIDTVTAISQPVINTVTATTQPVVDTVTAITQPVISTVTAATQPVISTVTAPTQPVIDTVTAITQPVINTVTETAPAITQPVGSLLTGIGGLLGHH